MFKRIMKSLPAHSRCRKCHRRRSKQDFGLRVMERDSSGKPTRIARQSWCKRCR